MSKSNSGRFVRAAWSLLFFQVIVSAGAVGVTGWAVMHVQDIAANQQAATQAAEPAASAEAADATPGIATDTAMPPATTVSAGADTTAPAPAPAATANAAPPAAAIAACARNQRYWRVTAQWCDTGVRVRGGQAILFIHGGGAALRALGGRVGDSPFRIVETRATSPADGTVLLAMNPDLDSDHQDYEDVYVSPQ